jgi:hypothetical protein
MIALFAMISLSFMQGPPESPSLLPAKYVGRAFDLGTGAFLYTEEHREVREEGRRVGIDTDYRDASGRVIVQRTASFRKHPTLAEFRTEDLRTGAMEGAEVAANGVRMFYRDTQDEQLQERTMSIPSPAAIDAGFNNYVQMNWDEIASGKKLSFHLAVPFRLDYYGFRIYKGQQVESEGRSFMRVICDIDNFVLRMFVDPIILTYDAEARRLVSYEGLSNISGDDGDNYVVKIVYDPYGP